MLVVNNLSKFRQFSYLYEKTCVSFSTSSYTTLDSSMKKYIDSKQYERALDLFEKHSKPHTNTCINMALKACTQLQDYQRGLKIVKQLSPKTLQNPFTQTSLIQFYMQHHDIDNANRIFSSISNKSNFTYTVMLKGYISNNMPGKALDLLDGITIQPDKFTLCVIFKACAQVKDERARKIGNQLLKKMPQNFENEIILLNSAISMLMSFGDIERAEHLFKLMKKKDVISYGATIKGYIENDMCEKALDLFEQMSVKPNDIIYSIILDACAELKNERSTLVGKKLLDQILKKSIMNQLVLTSAIHMLMNFGDVERAEQLFESIKKKDVVSYGAMMRGYVENNMSEKALDLFEQMSATPDNVIYIIVFYACVRLKNERAINIGNRILSEILNKPMTNEILSVSAIHMLMSFGDTKGAERLFELIKKKNTISYGAMMRGYVKNDMSEKALDLFERMSVAPDNVIYAVILKACAKMKNERSINIGKKLVDQMSNQLETADVVLHSAIHMLMRFNDIEGAEHLFGLIKKKDVFGYGILMQGYLENDMGEKALDLFEQMYVNPNHVLYRIVFNVCAQLKNERSVNIGNKILSKILNEPMTIEVLLGSAIHMLMSFGDVKRAEQIFELRKKNDIVSYGALMKGYVKNDMSDKVLDLFEQMSATPDNVIYVIIFDACARLKNERAIDMGKKLLDQILNKEMTDPVLLTSALHMLMSFGDVKDAEHLFELIERKNTITYGAMMRGYVENDMSDKALDLFENMSDTPGDVIYIIMLDACARLKNERAVAIGSKLLDQILNNEITNPILLSSALHILMRFGDEKRAEHLFESIKSKDMSIYGSMMKAYNFNGQPLKCLQFFQNMNQQNVIPDDKILTLPISACSQLGILAVCHSVVNQIPSDLYGKLSISNALIDMWGKAGSVKNAQQIFTTINNPNIITYNSMINAFGLNGKGAEAIDLFQQVPHGLRDAISYVSVLNSCSHSGLLNEARGIFKQVNFKSTRITTVMVDCLSRLYLFGEAQKVLAEYEKSNSPSLPMHMAILSGARNCRDSVVSKQIYNRMETLFSDKKNGLIAGSILLENIYSSLGNHDQASIMRSNRRINYGNKVKPGLSWTEKDGEIVSFAAHDHSHALSNEIHDEAKQIARELAQHGHQSDPSWITRPLGDDETVESVLCGHSERLAIAFHFIRGRQPSFIQITKNLRICGECHQATKLIAKIRECEILIRDANRMHHFNKNGTCSCQDHF